MMSAAMHHLFPVRPLATLVASLALLGGCSVTPKPMSSEEINTRVAHDQLKMFVDQEPVSRAIGFNEAVARALKYNLDYRLKLMESALSNGLADLSRYDMLPNLLLSAGYTSRSNDSGGNSVNIETRDVSLASSTSQERQRTMASAEFSWNVLDFGVSYYRARQQSNQALIADERRQRVIQNLLQEVRSSYWRAVGAQRLAREAEELNTQVYSALARSQEAERQGLVAPRDALSFQRLLLDAMSVLSTRRQELAYAKLELAALMNLAPGTHFELAEPSEAKLPPLPQDLAKIDEVALTHRPELREEDYRARVSADEARRQLLSLMPGLTLSTAFHHDSNKYLYNSSWNESGVQMGMNLLRLLSLPTMRRTHESQKHLDESRRQALSMAVLIQTRVALERYGMALQELELARASSNVDQRMADYARAALASRTDSELQLISARTRALNSEYQRYAAYATAQGAFARVYNSLGLEVIPEDLENTDLDALARSIGDKLSHIEQELFPQITADNAADAPRLPRPDARAQGKADVDSRQLNQLPRMTMIAGQPAQQGAVR
ncbi:TolC family protein [Azotobacter beijerinckii]|uniref:Outer membrane protein TolC n=1 Tax=Azotobacter beijerinckii TaxID=170623 RepID=A0A1I4GAV8_9GAMM|nr:TolC family protein [Azotobacter beijerinckii]SFA89030.1 Outer membrane protein TolC [Azotobacter beijerinckii]SFL27198.1 Outer membrane protein TolC [Azotobacter beijerinckii]